MKNIKSSLILSFAIAILTLSSCAPEKTELWFEKDGSGKVEVTIDLGDMADMMMEMVESLGDDLKESAKEEFDSEDGDVEDEELDIWSNEENMDSTMVFYDLMPDSLKQKMDNPEVLKNIIMHMKVDSEEEYAKIKLTISYKSSKHFEEILDGLKKASPSGSASQPTDEDKLADMVDGFSLDSKKGIIYIDGIDIDESEADPQMKEILEQLQNPELAEDQEYLNMMKSIIGGESSTIVHAPGKILFTNDPNAIIKGNTVIFKDDVIEVLLSKQSNNKVIKYKK